MSEESIKYIILDKGYFLNLKKITKLICNYVEYISYGRVRFLQNPRKSM